MLHRLLRATVAALPVLTLLAALPAAAPPAAAAQQGYTAAVLFAPSVSVPVGEPAGIGARVEPGGRRPVLLEELRAGGWRTVEQARTSRSEGTADLRWAPPTTGAHRLRLVAPRLERRGLARVVSATEVVYGQAAELPYVRGGRLPVGRQGVAYDTLLGDTPPSSQRWSVAAGRLPSGLALSQDGRVSGAPLSDAPRGTEVTFRLVEDGATAWTTRRLVVRPTPAPAVVSDLAPARTGQPYVDLAETRTPRSGRWSVVRGALPAGLALDRGTGVVIGTPTTPGTSGFRLRFTEVTGRTAVADDEITVVADGGTDWTSLRSDGTTTCGLQVDATGWCWGLNAWGSVGDGTTRPQPHPVRLPGRWTSLDTREGTTCGLRPDASAWCWGRNDVGTVGDGSGRDEVSVPTRLPGRWREIGFNEQADGSGFDTACGLRTDASLWCWGYDRYAQSGDGQGGADDVQPVPHQVPGRWAGLPVGTGATRCAIDLDAAAWCWGANQTGQVGNGRTVGTYGGEAPYELPGRWTSISTGTQSIDAGTTCGVQTDGSGWCWGANGAGQVGNGATGDVLVPTRLPGAWSEILTPTVREDPTCGLRPDGTAACWGQNSAGGVGDGTTGPQLTPYELEGTWASLRTADQTTCGVTPEGAGYCWGQDRYGAVGDGQDRRSTPAPPTLLDGTWRGIEPRASEDGASVCGLRTDDSAWCWGDARDGRAGTLPPDPYEYLLAPARLAGPGTWSVLDRTAGSGTPCGIGADGSGWCWGENERAAVGNGTLLDQPVPYGVVGGVG